VEIATIAEGEGAAAIAVHGRTRACRFEGPVEYETIAGIKAAVSIPVFANGEIHTAADARRVMQQTGADGVMIGRAALGAPWLPGQIAGVVASMSLAEKLAVMREHVELGHAFYGDAGTKIMRKHVQWYFEKFDEIEDVEWRRATVRAFNGLSEPHAQTEFLDRMVER
jgi:tRNA-dihydrouridine synthase B